MKNNLLFLFLLFSLPGITVSAKPILSLPAKDAKPDSGVFLLYKLEHLIGKETYRSVKAKDRLTYVIAFKLVDRGTPVTLNAILKTTLSGEPIDLKINGKISGAPNINDTIQMQNGLANVRLQDSTYTTEVGAFTFPLAGYAPAELQELLLRYWNNLHRPSIIPTLPYGSVQIQMVGTDTFVINKRQMVLNRYTVNGLIWGNEFLWTDQRGNLIGLITNDNTGDKFEFIKEPYESLLSQFIHKTAIYGTRLLADQLEKRTATPVIAVTGGTIIDVITGKATPNSLIIIEDSIIKSIGQMGTLEIPVNATVIDATGKTILPGLWDMHAHFGQAEWGPAYLAAGVPTIRDCTDEPDYIIPAEKEISAGRGIGPNILKAGLIDGTGPNAFGPVLADTKEEAVEAVDYYQKKGYAQIKIYSSVRPVIVKAIIDEAHRIGLTVTGHIPKGMTSKQAIDSSMDMVNHIYYVQPMMKLNKDYSINFDDSISRAAVAFLVAHNTVVDPTLGSLELTFRSKQRDITDIEPAFYTLPQVLQRRFRNTGMDQATATKYEPLYRGMQRLVKVLFDAGVPIVAGSDQGFPGYSLDREIELYVEAGLTPLQAIQTATIIPAKAMGLAQKIGSIQTGKQADLLIIDGNPLIDILNLRKVELTLKGNALYFSTTMRHLAGFKK
jgi:imidazolonepropionase-like amidohydrolase